MAWQDTMITMLRILVNDMASSPTYTDGRLEQVLAVAAKYVIHEITFSTTYTIDVVSPNITPDPTVTATLDNTFTNFVVMKAACIADMSTFRTEALRAGIKVRCGPAVLETVERLAGFKELLTRGPCAAYEVMKKDHMFGNGYICEAILSPFIGNTFDGSILGDTSTRSRLEYGGGGSMFD